MNGDMQGARERLMNRQYDVFEKVDGCLVWRAVIDGHSEAIRKLQELAGSSSNEFVLMHMPTKAVIATVGSSN
jgi:hypothetical protein